MDTLDPLRLSVVVNGCGRPWLSAYLGISSIARTMGGADLCSRALPAGPPFHLRLRPRSRMFEAGLDAGRVEFRLRRIDAQSSRDQRDAVECGDVAAGFSDRNREGANTTVHSLSIIGHCGVYDVSVH